METKISIGVKSNDTYVCHKTIKIEKKELEEIKDSKEIPDKYWNSILDFIDYQSKTNNQHEKITEVIVIYTEDEKDKIIYCDKMLAYFE